jgi:hypothetical protein
VAVVLLQLPADHRAAAVQVHVAPPQPAGLAAAQATQRDQIEHRVQPTAADRVQEPAVCAAVHTVTAGRIPVCSHAAIRSDVHTAAQSRLPLLPWAPGTKKLLITVSIELAEGLRVRRPAAELLIRGFGVQVPGGAPALTCADV